MSSLNLNPAGSRISFLDFLRSLSIIWLIGYHSYWFLGLLLAPAQVEKLFSTPFSEFLFLGHNGVDIFFVLSGYLICRSAFSLHRKYPNRWIRVFFIKRIFRILPALFCVAAIAFLINQFVPVAKNLQNIWANFLMLNNYLPVAKQALGWTWSLAIEEQFYFVFPFLLLFFFVRPRLFLPFCAVMLVVSLLIKHAAFVMTGPWGDTIPFLPVLNPAEFARYFDNIYSKTHVRFGPIVVGIATALIVPLLRQSNKENLNLNLFERAIVHMIDFLSKSPKLFALIGFTLLLAPLFVKQIYFESVFQKTLFSIGIAVLILQNQIYNLNGSERILIFRWLKKIADWSLWKNLALWSYSAFLINPLLILLLAIVNLRLDFLNSPLLFVLYFVACQVLSFCAAALIYKWVEEPMIGVGVKLIAEKSSRID